MTRKACGFFWSYRYGAKYCVVILDRDRKVWERIGEGRQRRRVKRSFCREYRADRVSELRVMARPYRLPRNVRQLCLSSVK